MARETGATVAESIGADVAQALDAANVGLRDFEQSLSGTGEASWAAWRDLRSSVDPLPALGLDAKANMQKIANDDALPAEHRHRVVSELHAAALQIAEAHRQVANAAQDRLEQTLAEAMTPPPSPDPGMRALTRGELDRVVGNASGPELLAALVQLVGRSPGWDAELLQGDYVRAVLAQHGVADQYPAFRAGAVARLINAPGAARSERQTAARNALLAMRRTNVRGRIVAYHQIAKMLLG